jgi:hypothetical protein
MSNNPANAEQSVLVPQTPTQLNPGAASPHDFQIEDRDGGQCGDGEAERAKLLAESNADNMSKLGDPLPIRNEIPHSRYPD